MNFEKSFTSGIAKWTTGYGSPVIVIGGGPGLSCSYLRDGLINLPPNNKFIFFDPPGCGESDGLATIDATVAVLEQLVQAEFPEARPIFLTHSWGSCILARLISLNPLITPAACALLNPAPLSAKLVSEVTSRLIARVPLAIMAEISELSSIGGRNSGEKIMNLALPSYCGHSKLIPSLSFNYDPAAAEIFNKSFPDYDLWHSAQRMGNVISIFGDTDYIASHDFDNSFCQSWRREIIQGGHFAYAESPEKIAHLLEEFFSRTLKYSARECIFPPM